MNLKRLYSKIPLLYSTGFFAKSLILLDSILHEETNFLSRAHLEDMKSLALGKPPKGLQYLWEVFIILIGETPLRVTTADCRQQVDYVTKIRGLLVKKELLNTMNNLDKYTIPVKVNYIYIYIYRHY